MKWRQKHIGQFRGRGVLLIRNPYMAIISLYNFKKTKSHTKSVSAETFQKTDFNEFVQNRAGRWLEIIEDWLLHSTDCYIIQYEVSR